MARLPIYTAESSASPLDIFYMEKDVNSDGSDYRVRRIKMANLMASVGAPYASKAALVSAAPNLKVDAYYQTANYSTAGDGGGNLYQLKDAGSAGARALVGADDGGSIIYVSGGSGGLYLLGLFPGGIANPVQFGCDPTGATDCATEMAAAWASGYRLDGLGKTYRCDEPVVMPDDLIFSDFTLDFSAVTTANADLLSAAGTEGTPQTLASTLTAGSFSVNVPDGSLFAEKQFAFLKSDAYWSPSTGGNVKYGELIKIAAISGNTLYLDWPNLVEYNTSDSATVTPITAVKGIRLTNHRVIAPENTGNQRAIHVKYGWDCVLFDPKTQYADYVHIWWESCIDCRVLLGNGNDTGVQEGLDYGILKTGACRNVTEEGYVFSHGRHVSASGGSQGINRFIKSTNCHGYYMTDAGFDAHAGVYEHDFIDCSVTFSDDATDTTMDGIISQGGRPHIENYRCFDNRRHGILWQPYILAATGAKLVGTFEQCKIETRQGKGASSSQIGALIQTPTASGPTYAPISSVRLALNEFDGHESAITVQAGYSKIEHADVSHNRTGDNSVAGVNISAQNADIENPSVIGNDGRTGGSYGARFLGSSGAGQIKNAKYIGNTMTRTGSAGGNGLYYDYIDGLVERGNVYDNFSATKATGGNIANIDLDDVAGASAHEVTGSSYTVLPYVNSITANRAGTVTITLPSAAAYPGRKLPIKTVQAQAVVSGSSNVVPITGGSAGTAILPATAGAWAVLKSDGTNWVVIGYYADKMAGIVKLSILSGSFNTGTISAGGRTFVDVAHAGLSTSDAVSGAPELIKNAAATLDVSVACWIEAADTLRFESFNGTGSSTTVTGWAYNVFWADLT